VGIVRQWDGMGRREDGGPTDGEVVARVLAGEHEAYGCLVTRYREALGRYATAVCGDADLAADAMQEAFIRAYEGLARCRRPERFGVWFFRILANQCRNHRARWRKHESLDAVGPTPIAVAAETTDGPLLRREVAHHLARALERLSPDRREAFVLRHVEGRSYGEMADLTSEREDTLRMRVHRAREQMQAMLAEVT
jgi:RNA polymerase sigma-70 factor (ECF subfamily)